MVTAYRMGQFVGVSPHKKDREYVALMPRFSLKEAALLPLPDGTLFGEASNEQVADWFVHQISAVFLPLPF